MPLDYGFLMGLPPMEKVHDLSFRDTILYALGVGAAVDAPTDADELRFVYEQDLAALPTMAVVLAYPGFWQKEPRFGINWQKLLHGEQSIEIHRPLPTEGRLRGVTTIDEIYDKGADKGAVMYSRREIFDAAGELVATCRQSSFLRADGGFGGRSDGAPKPFAVPERDPDTMVQVATRADQALLYRLSGDYNPLHADPAVATAAGFDRPILHGLATYGVVGRALLKALCGNDPARFKRMDVRFSSPVYPGETIELDLWTVADGEAAFRARVIERGVTVLQNGYLKFGE